MKAQQFDLSASDITFFSPMMIKSIRPKSSLNLNTAFNTLARLNGVFGSGPFNCIPSILPNLYIPNICC